MRDREEAAEMDADVGEVAPRCLGGGLGATGDRGKPGARRLRDGLGVVTTLSPVADQPESNHRGMPPRSGIGVEVPP